MNCLQIRADKSFLGMRGNALVLTATETLGQGILFLTSTFWALYVLELGASVAVVGLLSLVQGLVRISLQVPVGYLTDRMSRKKLVAWGGLLGSLAPFAYLFASSWALLIPGVILEAFTNIVLPARQAMFAEAVDDDKRATAFATIHTFFAIFASVMPVVSGVLLERMGLVPGMRLAFAITGVIMLLASIGRFIFLREDSTNDSPIVEKAGMKSVVLSMFEPVIKMRALRVAIVGSFLFSLAAGFLTRYSVVYAVDFIRLSKIQWGLVSGGIGVVGILTRIPIGRMIDRLSRRTSILMSYATRPFLILGFTGSNTFPQVLAFQLMDGVFSYVQQPALEALVIDLSSKQGIGRAYGAMNMIPGVALTVSPMLGALIWEALGAEWAFYASALFTGVAALFVLTFFKEPKKIFH